MDLFWLNEPYSPKALVVSFSMEVIQKKSYKFEWFNGKWLNLISLRKIWENDYIEEPSFKFYRGLVVWDRQAHGQRLRNLRQN